MQEEVRVSFAHTTIKITVHNMTTHEDLRYLHFVPDSKFIFIFFISAVVFFYFYI